MATAAEIRTLIYALEARIATFAGVKSTAFSDQATVFDYEGAVKELARLKGLLAVTGSRTRLAQTSKGV